MRFQHDILFGKVLSAFEFVGDAQGIAQVLRNEHRAACGFASAEMLAIVRDYCIAHHLQTDALALPDPEAPKPPKPESKSVSYDMYRSGMSLDEIAAERGFARATIEGHLAHYIGTGEQDILAFMEVEDVSAIFEYFSEHPNALHAEARAFFGEKYSYGQLEMVEAAMRYVEEG